MTFLLPVCTPPGPLDERLLGWLLALADLRARRRCSSSRRATAPSCADLAAAVCAALADRIEGAAASAEHATAAMDALRANFLGTAFRPVALTAGSRALIRVVSNLQWLCDRVDRRHRPAARPDRATPACAVLRGCAEVLHRPATRRGPRRPDRRRRRAPGDRLSRSYGNDIVDILAEPDDAAAVDLRPRRC